MLRGDQTLAQLLVGTAAPDELLEVTGISASGVGAALASVFFPAQHPQMDNQAF